MLVDGYIFELHYHEPAWTPNIFLRKSLNPFAKASFPGSGYECSRVFGTCPHKLLGVACCCLCWKNRAFVKATWMWLGAISFCTSLGGWVVGSHGGSKTTAIREAFLMARKAGIIDWIYPSTSISSGQWRLWLGFPSLNMFHWWWLATCMGGRSNIDRW